ncbi:MAG: phosphoglucosamine mutase [bacterium]
MTLKISISGVRGFVPDSLTPEICLNFAKAFGTYLNGGTIVVGIDPRASSEIIKGIVFTGLVSTGCKVIDLGICPTPTVGIMVRKLKAAGGIIITASHNPLPWNGLKFVRSDGIFLNENQANKLINIFETKEFIAGRAKKVKTNKKAIETHIKKVLKIIKPTKIRRKKFRVAIDCCNGAGSVACVKFLKKLGCTVLPINCDLTKPFPHNPEPIAENLQELMELIQNKKADIGFALDSDADRLAIVSEKGLAIGEELTLTLATQALLMKNKKLAKKKKIVVTNLSTTNALEDIVKANGGILIRTKIGEVHVAEELKNLKGLIGGEGNGGVIFPQVGFNRDSLSAIALILNLLATTKKTVSELAAALPVYYMIKEKISCQTRDEVDDLIELTKNLFKGNDFIMTDGVKVLLENGWLHVRSSNTEPIVRVMAESKDENQAKRLIEQVLQAVK